MITFLPELHTDELLFSWLSRYHIQSGNLSFRHTAEELYVSRQTVPDVGFLNAMRPEVWELMSRYCAKESLILDHTMFPAYGRFLPKERKREAYEALCRMQGNFHNLLSIPKREKGKARVLRYCPVCAEQDRKQHGEAYWHRCHQIPGIRICHAHGCFLKESTFSMGKKESSGFYTAEEAVRSAETAEAAEKKEIVLCTSKEELACTGYIVRVFQEQMDLENGTAVSDFLRLRLEKKYARTESGASLDMEKFYADYRGAFGEGCLTKEQVQKVLSGQRYHFEDICKIAMFSGIKEKELTCIPEEARKKLYEPVFLQVAEEGGYDYELVRDIGSAVLKVYEGRRKPLYRKRKDAVWQRMDIELLPKVRTLAERLYQQGEEGEERPQRVTVSLVQKRMGLPDKRFDRLPLCRAEILRYKETQTEYWARKCVWAYRKLKKEGETVITWRKIRDLTNIKKKDLAACSVYLEQYAERQEAEALQRLV